MQPCVKVIREEVRWGIEHFPGVGRNSMISKCVFSSFRMIITKVGNLSLGMGLKWWSYRQNLL